MPWIPPTSPDPPTTMLYHPLTGTVLDTQIPATITRDSELTAGLATKANTSHPHSGADITTGTVADARIAATITRNSQLAGYYSKAEVDAKVAALQSQITAQQAQIAAMQTTMNNLAAIFQSNVSRSGNDITFSGVNVRVVSGSGSTSGTVNGYGNLIIGYNEPRPGVFDRTGSHNLVVGSRHNYSSYGGIIAGFQNTMSAEYASLTGGNNNRACGPNASVSGGRG